jgi:hypothetical protein
MRLTELRDLCAKWDGTREGFRDIVAGTISLGLYLRELAADFEVAESTVSRWARGIARPHPRLQKLVVADIERRVQSALKSSERGYGAPPDSLAARSR